MPSGELLCSKSCEEMWGSAIISASTPDIHVVCVVGEDVEKDFRAPVDFVQRLWEAYGK